MEPVKEITRLPRYHEVISGSQYTIVAFYTSWSGPFQAIGELYRKLASENTATVKCYEVDLTKAEDIAQVVNVPEVPAFVLYKSGQKVQLVKGLVAGELMMVFNQTKMSQASDEVQMNISA